MEVHCSAPPATKPKRSDIKMAEPVEIPAAGTSDDGMYKFLFIGNTMISYSIHSSVAFLESKMCTI